MVLCANPGILSGDMQDDTAVYTISMDLLGPDVLLKSQLSVYPVTTRMLLRSFQFPFQVCKDTLLRAPTSHPHLTSQIHSHSHTPATDQQHRPQPLCQNLQIAHVLDALILALTGSIHRTRQRCEHDCRIFALRSDELVENKMLCAAGQIVE